MAKTVSTRVQAQMASLARRGDYQAQMAVQNQSDLLDTLGIIYKPRAWVEAGGTSGEKNLYIQIEDLTGKVIEESGISVLIEFTPQFNFMNTGTFFRHSDGNWGYYVGESPANEAQAGWAYTDASGGTGAFIESDCTGWVLCRISVDGALPIQVRVDF